jgi:peptidoglycan hydrolase-like protein with peptidoglycan-binding domain
MKKTNRTARILISAVFIVFVFQLLELTEITKVLAFEKNISTIKDRRGSYFSGSEKYYSKDKMIKILIVPGHDDNSYGAYYNGIREVELNRELAKNLYNKLSVEPGFEVILASDSSGYNPVFNNYFEVKRDEITKFINEAKYDFSKKIKDGEITEDNENFHNVAPAEVALKLYGFNMWLNENNFDFVFHIHFNDYGGRSKHKEPKYNGFSIYMPDKQFSNYELSRQMAEKVFDRIGDIVPVSNLPQESMGIIESQELIAVGSNDALDASSLLIEYGYIYEPQFTDPETRGLVLEDLAYQTYVGIKEFFGEKPIVASTKFNFTKDLDKDLKKRTKESYALQKQLAILGHYPPSNKTFNDCPPTGIFGECTLEAVKSFQLTKGLPVTGYVGEMTRKILNSL